MDGKFASDKRMRKNDRLWDDLPQDVLQSVMERLNCGDCVRFAAVCKPWRSIAEQTDINATRRVPWLLFHVTENCRLKFFDVCEGRLYYLALPESLEGGQFWAACKGWVLMAKGRAVRYIGGLYEAKLYLVDPMSGIQIRLPDMSPNPFDEHRTPKIKKLVLLSSADVWDPSCVAAVIFDGWRVLAICKLEGKTWSIFDWIDKEDSIADILFSDDGTLYALVVGTYYKNKAKTSFGTHVVRVGDCDVILKLIPWEGSFMSFLVQSDDGGLLIASRILDTYEVFRLDSDSGNTMATAIKVNDLGDRIMLLTRGRSLSIPILIFSQGSDKVYKIYNADGDCIKGQHSVLHLRKKGESESIIVNTITSSCKTWFRPNIQIGNKNKVINL